MNFKEIEHFFIDCLDKGVEFPKNPMIVVIDDFHEAVLPMHKNSNELEIRCPNAGESAVIKIIPPPEQ